MGRRAAFVIALALGVSANPAAVAATLSWSASTEIHAAMPFTLTLTAEGFEEEPVPTAPQLVIDNCEVTFLGVAPNVSSHIQIVNGRRSEWREVTFSYRWRVVAPQAGSFPVPPLRVEQGEVSAQTRAASFTVTEVPETDDMSIRLRLPERPVWVGETFDVTVEWLLARDVESHQMAIPLFDVDGAHVEAPVVVGQQSMRFEAAAGEVALPLERSEVREAGRRYTRFAFPARVTLNRVGSVDLAPVRVVARLQSGTARDVFGLRRARYALYRAEGQRRRLVVRSLPVAGRPDTFVNAIGSGFAIDVQASRTVVAVGDPIELTVRLRGDGPLTGLSLPPLGGPEALPTAHFSVPEGSVVGEVDEQAKAKTFTTTVRVKSAEVREVPPIAFAYFDPLAGEYRTVTSRPIALSVGAAELVGAADVVAAKPTPSVAQAGDGPPATSGSLATLLGADMALSAPARTFARPWGGEFAAPVLPALYALPSLVFAAAYWRRRTEGRRGRSRRLRQALREVEAALDSGAPARESAPAIVAAMRRLAQTTGAGVGSAATVLERLETSAFDPAAAHHAVADQDIAELRQVARNWGKASSLSDLAALAAKSDRVIGRLGLGRKAAPNGDGFRGASAVRSPVAAIALAGVLLAFTWDGPAAHAETIDDARVLYQTALNEMDRLRRVRLFTAAEQAFRPLALANPSAAELQVDWGNAALGAQDTGRAVLAYRRALRHAPNNPRARANLAWLRGLMPVWLPRPAAQGALDSLLFWRSRTTPAQLYLVGAVAFAIGVLLLAPWSRRAPRWLRAAAAPAMVVWIAASASALLADDQANAAVVLVDGATLRSADSTGASPAFANPLPAGTELTVVEARDSWLRVALADGTPGWLAASAVSMVHH